MFTDLPPGSILKDLQSQGIESVVIIGRSVVNTLFMKEHLIDEIHVAMVPRVFGRGLSMYKKVIKRSRLYVIKIVF